MLPAKVILSVSRELRVHLVVGEGCSTASTMYRSHSADFRDVIISRSHVRLATTASGSGEAVVVAVRRGGAADGITSADGRWTAGSLGVVHRCPPPPANIRVVVMATLVL